MGMTHHWRQHRPFTAPEWKNLCAEARRIFTAASARAIALAGADGVGEPLINEVGIAFNGKAPRHCEAFILERNPGPPRVPGAPRFEFCKTEHQPYDCVVLTILAAAREFAGVAIEVTSDAGDDAIRKHL